MGSLLFVLRMGAPRVLSSQSLFPSLLSLALAIFCRCKFSIPEPYLITRFTMSAQGYYNQGGPPQYPQQSYGPPGQGGYGPPQGMQYGMQPPPQQKEKKDRGCLMSCLAVMCCCFLCEESCECCFECCECLADC